MIKWHVILSRLCSLAFSCLSFMANFLISVNALSFMNVWNYRDKESVKTCITHAMMVSRVFLSSSSLLLLWRRRWVIIYCTVLMCLWWLSCSAALNSCSSQSSLLMPDTSTLKLKTSIHVYMMWSLLKVKMHSCVRPSLINTIYVGKNRFTK